MSRIDEILEFNRAYVARRGQEQYKTTVRPDKKLAILTCMDTRLTASLLAALGLRDGDAKIIKNAGAVITDPYGATMRSLLIAIHLFDVEDILVIGHLDCGVEGLRPETLIGKMREKGISQEAFDAVASEGVDLGIWLAGFENLDDAIKNNVRIIKDHPLVPNTVIVHALKIDPKDGQLHLVI